MVEPVGDDPRFYPGNELRAEVVGERGDREDGLYCRGDLDPDAGVRGGDGRRNLEPVPQFEFRGVAP